MQDSAEKSHSVNGAKQVGYRHPPETTRFKKGQSGNPKGRRKGSLNVSTVFAQTLREKVVVNENGRRKTMTKFEAAIKQFVNKAASGDLRALQLLLSLSREAETRESQPKPNSLALSESDQKVMEGIMKRFQAVTGDQGGARNE
ncbi:MAG: DUF5681 domain-containing protein [Candidatus Sulfotelmatobacter sp.]